MANCSVLEAHQKPTDKPMRRIKRSGGQSLVRQQLAVWLIENVLLQMVEQTASTLRTLDTLKTVEVCKRYIPDKMPPVEIPGVRFVPPAKNIGAQPLLYCI